jgi:hypothetical protein
MYQSTCSQASLGKLYVGCNQHKQPDNTILTFYPTLSPTPIPIAVGLSSGPSDCDCTHNYTTGAGYGANWASAFGMNQEWWLASSSNQDMLALQNQQFASGSIESFNNCYNYGFKTVAAKKQWHGSYGWTSNDGCYPPSQSLAPDQIKYCSVSVNASYSYKNVNDYAIEGEWVTQYSIGASANGSVNVNPDTGIISSTVNTTQATTYPYTNGKTGSYIGYYSNGGAGYTNDGNDIITTFAIGGTTVLDFDMFTQPYCVSDLGGVNNALNDWNDWASNWYATGSIITPNYTSGGWSASSNYDVTIGTSSYNNFISISVSRTATTYAWNVSSSIYTQMEGNALEELTYTGSLTLGCPYSSSMVVDTCQNLLGNWDLSRNDIYPWRTDGFTTFAPLVGVREVQQNISMYKYGFISPLMNDLRSPIWVSGSIAGYNTMPWVDPNAFYWVMNGSYASATGSNHFDGSTIGAPNLISYTSSIVNGTASYADGIGWGWFDFYYTQIDNCPTPTDNDCVGPIYQNWPYFYGGTLADSYISEPGLTGGPQLSSILPQASTHWVNNNQALGIPNNGASRTCGTADSAIWVTKWAQTRLPYPHYNYFRPCGDDRVLVDTTTMQCITSYPIMAGQLVGLASGSNVLLYQTGNDGIYTGCSQSDNGDGTWTLTTGSLVDELPTNYLPIVSPAPYAGLVRFPNAYGFCGRQGITLTPTGSHTEVNFLSPVPNLRTGDVIDLYKQDMTLVASGSVTYIDDNDFLIPSASYTGVVWAQCHGSPNYEWNDTNPKFEDRYQSWYDDSNRNSSFNYSSDCSQFCLPYSPCSEQVWCASPNSESFVNGKTVWFTDLFQADGFYGSWQACNVEFGMNDLLYQNPPTYCPCSPTTEIRQDDGTCIESGVDPNNGNPILYFPLTPQVEAVCNVPSGSPSLPAGISILPLTKPSLAGVLDTSYGGPFQPWQIYNNIVTTCASGSCAYANLNPYSLWCNEL